MAKKVTQWAKVKTGDIISFRYKGKQATGTLTTILVLNPKWPHKRKDGSLVFHLIGLKLEKQGVIPHIRNKEELIELLERIGNLSIVDAKNEIWRVDIRDDLIAPRGFRQAGYKKLRKYFEEHGVYRTYLWDEAKNSSVFLEPISLPKRFKEMLVED